MKRVKKGIKRRKYQQKQGATAACNMIMMEATKGVGQRYKKGATKGCFLIDTWLSSKKLAEAAMEFGANLIGPVKTYTKLFFNETI